MARALVQDPAGPQDRAAPVTPADHDTARADAAQAGAAPRPDMITLAVENMHCGNCMRKVEQTLSQLPGVSSARVNLSAKRVAIVSESKPATAEPFVAALAGIGFPASVLADAPDSSPRATADADFLKRIARFSIHLEFDIWFDIAPRRARSSER